MIMFKEMSKLYLITNDKGRSMAYQKAIEAIKRCTHPNRTYEVTGHSSLQIFSHLLFLSGNQSFTLRKTIISR
jgi:hypothetical protein